MGRGGCRKCNVLGVLLRIMQSEGVKVKGLIFSEVTLILRSSFAHPSLCLRSGFALASLWLQGSFERLLAVLV